MRTNGTLVSKAVNFCKMLRIATVPLLLQPTFIGVLFSVSLSTWSLVFSLSHDKYEGADAAGVRQFLSGEYQGEVMRALWLVVALSALLGIFLGLAVSVAIRLKRMWLRRKPLGRAALAWRSSLGILVVYGLVWLDDIVTRPALYQDFLYARGGISAAFQTWATEHCGQLSIRLAAGLGCGAWLLFPLIGRPGAKIQSRKFGLAIVTASACFVLASLPWHRIIKSQAQSNSNKGRTNVLIVAADSLRPDRITPKIAPRLYELSQSGIAFDRAYTPLARTFPAWVSILTGNYPHHHGIRNMFPRWETRLRNFHAVPAAFAGAGYATGVVSDFAGDIFRRIDLGFQKLRTPTFTMRELMLERILQQNVALLPWLRGPLARFSVPVLREMHVASDAHALTLDALASIDDAAQQPFFMTVFYSTTHFPYAAPSPFYDRFVKPDYRGKYRYAKADTLAAEASLTDADIEHIRGLFDGAVASVDAAVGELLDRLTARGLSDHTIIVITADHGKICMRTVGVRVMVIISMVTKACEYR